MKLESNRGGRWNSRLAKACLVVLSTEATALARDQVRLITLDPGHFHAALVQKLMYPQVDPVVYVYS